MDLADFSQVSNLRDIARSSKFDHLWWWRFKWYSPEFWSFCRMVGCLRTSENWLE